MLRSITLCSLVALVAIFAYNFLDELFVYYGEPVYVDSVYGKLKGRIVKVRGGREIYSFTNVPYGKHERFQPPVPYGKWEDEVLDATRPVQICMQYETIFKRVDGVEDCLNVQIYTPKIDKSKPLPVMVWIHGGHFMFGGNNIYGPDYLLEKEDIVLVAVNYRLNSLGFLSTGDIVAPGNNGLKDQNLALQWVKDAIKDFGGDPNSVTIFGCSAGGASVNYHIVSPMSKGLFHRAISQSGSSLCPWAFTRHPKRQAKRLAEKLNCSTAASKSSTALVKCLQELPAEQIVAVHKETTNVFHETDAIFGPIIEPVDDAAKTKGTVFLPDSPYKLYKLGQFAKVPWITGVTSEDGCFRSSLIVPFEDKLDEMNEKWSEAIPKGLILYKDDPTMLENIKKYYFGNKKLGARQVKKSDQGPNKDLIGWDDLQGVTNMFSDRYFLGCAHDAAAFHAKHAPTYTYYFTNKVDISFGNIMEMTPGNIPVVIEIYLGYMRHLLYRHVLNWELSDFGVCHTDDLQSLFNLNPMLEVGVNSPRYEFSRKMVKLWISFAKNGKPDAFDGVNWIPLEVDKKTNNTATPLKYLRLGQSPAMIEEPFTERLKFWEGLRLPQN